MQKHPHSLILIVCTSIPTGSLPMLGPQSWRSFPSRWRRKTSVLSNWSTSLTKIWHWLAWTSPSLDRSLSQTRMRRTTERGRSHPDTTIPSTLQKQPFLGFWASLACLRHSFTSKNVSEKMCLFVAQSAKSTIMAELQLQQSIILLGTENHCCHSPHTCYCTQ